MKVFELINQLQRMPPDSDVVIIDKDEILQVGIDVLGCSCPYGDLTLISGDFNDAFDILTEQ